MCSMVEDSEPLGRAEAQATRSPGRTLYAQLRVSMAATLTETARHRLLDHQPIPPPDGRSPPRQGSESAGHREREDVRGDLRRDVGIRDPRAVVTRFQLDPAGRARLAEDVPACLCPDHCLADPSQPDVPRHERLTES